MSAAQPFVATVGMFDGVHKGHRTVLDFLVQQGKSRALPVRVYSFASHPLSILAPDRAPRMLSSAGVKEHLLRESGIDSVVMLDFEEIAPLTASQFLTRLRDEGCRLLVMGFNNHIGSDRLTADEAARLGIVEVIQVQRERELGHVCSTAIRAALEAGDVAGANNMLAQPFAVTGKVGAGKALGRTIGFPTANIVPDDQRQLLPATGVYAVRAGVGGEYLPAMAYIGRRPTVDGPEAAKSLEVNIFDFDKDIYNAPVEVQFVQRIRDEKKFDNLNRLQEALTADREAAIKILSRK